MTPKFDSLINEMSSVSGPTAGTGHGDSGPAQFLALYARIKLYYKNSRIGGSIYPNDTSIPANWDVQPGSELPNKQEFSIGRDLRVQATFKPLGRSSSGRIRGEWKVDRAWRNWNRD